MNGVQGIFKPAQMREVPLSIMTAPEVAGKERPYEDDFGTDDLLVYRYQGDDPGYRDNRGLRAAMERRTPLIYLSGLTPGRYEPEWPVYVVGEDPQSLSFMVEVRDHKFVALPSRVGERFEPEDRRQYATRSVRMRLHQNAFRQAVIRAYRVKCAICRLRHEELLDAAHILPDGHPHGLPVLPNGISLCKLHHAAFDQNIVGITPDLTVAIRDDVLREQDGPMLLHGLKDFHNEKLQVPGPLGQRPSREFLAERFEVFRRSA